MAISVASCKFLRTGQAASVDERGRGTYSATWRAKVVGTGADVDKKLGPKAIASGALSASPHPLPDFGDSYDLSAFLPSETDAYSYAQGYSFAFHGDDRSICDVTVTFAPATSGGGQLTSANRAIANPFSRTAELWWDEESYTRIVDKDKDGVALTNAAGRSFDRPPTIEETRGVLIAEFAVANLADAISLNRTYSNAVNSSTWTWANSAAARTVICRYARSGRLVEEGSHSYYPFTMAFAFRESGQTWDMEILNEGFGYLEGGVYKKSDDLEPVKLAADGTKLAEGGTATYRTFRVRREVDFNTLTTSYLT
jgi:hypothetical protein